MIDLTRARAHIEVARSALAHAGKYLGPEPNTEIARHVQNADDRLDRALRVFDALEGDVQP
jgi:hypothetical protein